MIMQVAERAVVPANEISIIVGALNALKRGDASVRLPPDWTGPLGRLADAFNDVVERNERMAHELQRLSRVVGKEGKLSKRGTLGDVTGFWRDPIDAVNQLIDDLVHPTSESRQKPVTSPDRKSTRLNSSHMSSSYVVCCLK